VPIDGLTPLQAITLVGLIRGGRRQDVRQRTHNLIEALEIGAWADKPGETLSGGVRRLVAFCMAIVMPGQLVILDEPTNDVDPLRRRLLWQEVRSLADQGSAVLLVTHNVLEAERSVGRLAIIDQGRVVAAGTAASLKEREAGYLRLELILEPGVEPPSQPAFLSRPVIMGRRMMAKMEASSVGQAVAWASTMKEQDIAEEFSVGPATLEEVPMKEVDHVIHAQLAA
jgi:ABC-2 type transport system ATP-binding protein